MTNRTLIGLIIAVLVVAGIMIYLGSYEISQAPLETLTGQIIITTPGYSPTPSPGPSPVPSPVPPPCKGYKCVDEDGEAGINTPDIVEVYCLQNDGTEKLISETPSVCVRIGGIFSLPIPIIGDPGYPNGVKEAYCYSAQQSALTQARKCPKPQVCLTRQVSSKRWPDTLLNVGYCAPKP